MNWHAFRKKAAALKRNLNKQQELIIELLTHPDTTMAEIEQARQYARNVRDTRLALEEIEGRYPQATERLW